MPWNNSVTSASSFKDVIQTMTSSLVHPDTPVTRLRIDCVFCDRSSCGRSWTSPASMVLDGKVLSCNVDSTFLDLSIDGAMFWYGFASGVAMSAHAFLTYVVWRDLKLHYSICYSITWYCISYGKKFLCYRSNKTVTIQYNTIQYNVYQYFTFISYLMDSSSSIGISYADESIELASDPKEGRRGTCSMLLHVGTDNKC